MVKAGVSAELREEEWLRERDLTVAMRLIAAEGMAADDRNWEQWLDCFAEECVYWIPTWRGDGTLTSDPRKELSHIYYEDKSALRDRTVRLKSPASPASSPPPRTVHQYSSFVLRDDSATELIKTRCSWSTFIFEPFTRITSYIFGFQEHDIRNIGDSLSIVRKKVVLQNDYIKTMLDVQMF